MPYDAFTHVDYWVFDLDNTLYPPHARLFDQIERLMADYVIRELNVTEEKAQTLRRKYWQEYGTTLAGLMHVHNIDPDPYLHEVHQLDLSHIEEAPNLRKAISDLPGRKIIYTNGSRAHGERVSSARGLDGVFDAIYGVEDAAIRPNQTFRPSRRYSLWTALILNARQCLKMMFETLKFHINWG